MNLDCVFSPVLSPQKRSQRTELSNAFLWVNFHAYMCKMHHGRIMCLGKYELKYLHYRLHSWIVIGHNHHYDIFTTVASALTTTLPWLIEISSHALPYLECPLGFARLVNFERWILFWMELLMKFRWKNPWNTTNYRRFTRYFIR